MADDSGPAAAPAAPPPPAGASSTSARLYVGDIPGDTRSRELEAEFSKFGRLHGPIALFTSGHPPYACVEFESRQDAEEAVRAFDGRPLLGRRVRVEFAKPREPRGDRQGSSFRAAEASSGAPPLPAQGHRRSNWRALITGLSSSTTWMELKDFAREVRGGKGAG